MNPRPWYVYLLECVDGSIYTGIAVDVEARFQAHLSGKGARYTRSHPPLRLLGCERHASRSAAASAEARIKKLQPAAKRACAAAMATGLSANP